MTAQRMGGTVVVMEHFDPEQCLALIEEHKVTHAQFVPTMFVRMLKLPDEVRNKLRPLVAAFGGARRRALRARGQAAHDRVVGPGDPRVLLGHRGPGHDLDHVRRGPDPPGLRRARPSGARCTSAVTTVRTCRPATTASSTSARAAGAATFEYNHDPEKTRQTFNDKGWSTLWDVGHVDDDGYLYLTDRKLFMIVSGGVNIYPQEIEDVLVAAPRRGRRGRLRHPGPRNGGGGQGRRPARPRHRARPGARGRRSSPSAGPTSRTTSARARSTSPTCCPGARTASSTRRPCARPIGPARPPAPPEPRAACRTSAYQASPSATTAPNSSTLVMPTASTTGPMSRLPDADRPPEAHHPQRHDPAPHVLVDPGLQGGVQRRDEGEVEGARDGHGHVGRHRAALQGEGAERQRVAHEADPHQHRLRGPGEDRPDGDGTDAARRCRTRRTGSRSRPTWRG